jgi:hypothetical protein
VKQGPGRAREPGRAGGIRKGLCAWKLEKRKDKKEKENKRKIKREKKIKV